jgi:hypothetical protein
MSMASATRKTPRTYATNELPEDGAVCVVRPPPEHDPMGKHGDMLAIYWRGDWILRGDRGGEQVIAAKRANYIIVRQILSKGSIYTAVRKVDQMDPPMRRTSAAQDVTPVLHEGLRENVANVRNIGEPVVVGAATQSAKAFRLAEKSIYTAARKIDPSDGFRYRRASERLPRN